MFRTFRSIAAAVALALTALTDICGQAADRSFPANDRKPCVVSRSTDRETQWYRHELGIISICLPETLIRRRTERCGEECYIFEDDGMFFDADLSVSAWRPTFEKKYRTYSGESRTIDGKASTVWFFEDKGKFKYVSGVNIVLERGQIGMGIYLFSNTPNSKSLAEIIFNSIKIKDREN